MAERGKPGPEWFSRAEMARIFGCTTSNFQQRIKPIVPTASIHEKHGKGGKVTRVWYHGRGVIEAWSANEAMKSGSDDPMVVDTSPELERFRKARASLAELDLEARQGDLMSRTDVHEGLAAVSAIYRRAGQRLRSRFGDEAYQIIDEGWDDAGRMIDQRFGQPAEATA